MDEIKNGSFDKIESGTSKKFTITSSVAFDVAPSIAIKDISGTLVSSQTAVSSSSQTYYAFVISPTSVAFYTYEWRYIQASKNFIDRGTIEVVETTVIQADLYCNANDVRNLYKPLNNSDYRNAEIDEFIKDIMNEVDSKLGVRFAVPFMTGVNSLPPIIGTITKNLTLVKLLRSSRNPPDWVNDERERYEGYLDKLASGEMTLVTSAGVTIEMTESNAQVIDNKENYKPTFNMLDYEQQVVDSNRLDDEFDELS